MRAWGHPKDTALCLQRPCGGLVISFAGLDRVLRCQNSAVLRGTLELWGKGDVPYPNLVMVSWVYVYVKAHQKKKKAHQTKPLTVCSSLQVSYTSTKLIF